MKETYKPEARKPLKVTYRETWFNTFTSPSGDVDILGLLQTARAFRVAREQGGKVADVAEQIDDQMRARGRQPLEKDHFSDLVNGYLDNKELWNTLLDMQDAAKGRSR